MREPAALQISALIGATALAIAVWFLVRRWPPSSSCEALRVGLLWVILTVAFEFFMDLVLAGRPSSEAPMAYDVPAGRAWVFLLLWIAPAPVLFYRLGVAKTARAA